MLCQVILTKMVTSVRKSNPFAQQLDIVITESNLPQLVLDKEDMQLKEFI